MSNMFAYISMKKPYTRDIDAITQIMRQSLSGRHPKMAEIYDYLLKKPGKQVRSLLVLMIGQSMTDKTNLHRLAAGIELIHLASLIHDDIIDDADTRRNQPSLHRAFGTQNAIIIGVHCYSVALSLFAPLGEFVVATIANTVTALSEGEFNQVNDRHNIQMSEDTYWDIVQKKTSSLFYTACLLSAHITGLPQDIGQTVGKFGTILGDIFQLTDDYLDFFDTHDQLGKKIEQDMAMGDISLPIILAQAISPSQHLADLKPTLITHRKTIINALQDAISKKHDLGLSYLSKMASHVDTSSLQGLLQLVVNRVTTSIASK